MTVADSSSAQNSQNSEQGGDTPPDEAKKFLLKNSFLQVMEGGATGGAYERGSNGFCKCAPDYCKSLPTATTFTCKSTAKGWARASLTDDTCACAPGFCAMEIAGVTPVQKHCTPAHADMIRDASGNCACRAAVAAVVSNDPTKAVMAKPAACKILPVKPMVVVPGGKDEYGKFDCVGAPYTIGAGVDTCGDCSAEGSCKMARTGAGSNFLCFKTTAGSATQTAPYVKKADGSCECGADQCLMPNGDHEVCRDLK